MSTEQGVQALVRLKLILLAIVFALVLSGPGLAYSFGSVTLKPGEKRNVSIFGFGGYQRVRVCNDLQSASTVTVTIRPREPRVLQPGRCTEDSGDEIEFQNQETGEAMVSYYPVSSGGFGMFGN